MTDIFQAQQDLFAMLCSDAAFATVNIVNERKLIVDSTVQFDAIWLTPRNGRSGNGVLVREPKLNFKSPGAPGPLFTITFPVQVFQAGDAALLPDVGGGFTAPQLAIAVVNALHQWQVDGLGMIAFDGNAYAPVYDYDGLNCIEVTPTVQISGSAPTDRVGVPIISGDAAAVAITSATAEAEIYYTTDGTFPTAPGAVDPVSQAPLNAGSTLYSAPFAATAGTIIRACAYQTGLRASSVRKFTVPEP